MALEAQELEAWLGLIGPSDAQEQELWRAFLARALSSSGREEATAAAREPIAQLLEQAGESAVAAKLVRLAPRLPAESAAQLLGLVVEVSGELRQQSAQKLDEVQKMLSELATPIIRIWTDVLLIPLIGSLDATRAQTMAETLLSRTSATRAKVVVVDVTGVPVIDTMVGGFLIEMFTAVRLLGAEVILTGIKPNVAHTLVKLGVDFRMVSIARDLEDALRRAIAIIEEDRRLRRQLSLNFTRRGGGESGEDVEA
jgi:rsbT co-antagonist protein RsbR